MVRSRSRQRAAAQLKGRGIGAKPIARSVIRLGLAVAIALRTRDCLGRLDRADRTGSSAQTRLKPQEDRAGQADSEKCRASPHVDPRLEGWESERQFAGFRCRLPESITGGDRSIARPS